MGGRGGGDPLSRLKRSPRRSKIQLLSTTGRGRARLALAVAVIAVSWAAILIRAAAAPPLAIAFWRLTLATAILSPLAWWLARGRPVLSRQGPTVVAGILLGLHFALWISSLFRTTVGSSVLLVSTQPIFAALAAGPLLGEKPSRRTLWAITLTLAGSGVLTAGDARMGTEALWGDAMALAAAAAAAIYLVLGRRERASGPLPVYLWKVNMIAAATLLAACFLSGTPLAGFPGTTWAIFAALAAGPHLAGHGLLNFAVRFFPAPTVNLALAGEPLLSTSYAAVLLGEVPGGPFYAGAALILMGLVVEFSAGAGRPWQAS